MFWKDMCIILYIILAVHSDSSPSKTPSNLGIQTIQICGVGQSLAVWNNKRYRMRPPR